MIMQHKADKRDRCSLFSFFVCIANLNVACMKKWSVDNKTAFELRRSIALLKGRSHARHFLGLEVGE